MLYIVTERLPNGKLEPIKVTTTFEGEFMPELKDKAEEFYIRHYLSGNTKPELRFILNDNDEIHFLSEDYLMQGAIVEAKQLTLVTGVNHIAENWEDRKNRLIKKYSKK